MTQTKGKRSLLDADSAMNSKATPQKHDLIIIKNHPEHEGQIYQVKEVKRDGAVITDEGHIFYPEFFDIVSDWQQYNGGFGRFNETTGELVEEKDIKKEFTDRLEARLAPDGWVNFIVLQVDTGLNPHDLRKWLKDNEGTIVEQNPDPKDPTDEEWRLISVASGNKKAPDVATNEKLSTDERDRLRYLESLIEASFVVVGRSLKEIRDSRLYRETHINFDSYCRARWKMVARNAERKIAASDIYEIIRVSKRPNWSHENDEDSFPMPKSESQLRPIADSPLEPKDQVVAWEFAVEQAKEDNKKYPTASMVKRVVCEMTKKEKSNPHKVGDVCKYVGVTGKTGVWCIVQSVGEFSCTVEDYRQKDFQVRPDEIKNLELPEEEEEFMRSFLPRLQTLSDTSDVMALHTLSFFGKLNRGYLSKKEEAILKVLEGDG